MKKFSALFIAFFLMCGSLFAQRLNVTSISEKNDQNNFYTMMKEAFPLAYNDPVAPRFVFFDDSRNYIFGIGGYVKTVGVYDFNGVTDYNYFTTSSINMKHNQPSSSYGMTIGQSHLFFKLLGNTDIGRVVAYVDMEFEGPQNTPMLRQAFVQFKGLTIGQTWSTFCDMGAVPFTIDEQGPSSAIEIRQPQIRYTHHFGDRLQASAAIEYANPSFSVVDGQSAYIRQQIPDVPVTVTYTMTNGNHLRVGGIIRNVSYKDLITDDDKIKTGWGATVSGAVNVFPSLQMKFQGVYGKGIANYIQDIAGLGYDMIPKANHEGTLETPGMWGAFAAAQYDWNKDISTTLVYSYARLEKGGDLAGSTYKHAQYAAANVTWKLSEFGMTGIEYVFGRRNNFNGDYGNASRINVMMQYNF